MYNDNVIQVDFIKPVRLTGSEKVLLRDIWSQLGCKRQFADWALDHLQRFKKDNDYGFFHGNVKNSNGRGRPAIEYWVTIDTAKCIAMMSHTEEGDRVRAYFLECEKLVFDNGLQGSLAQIPQIMTAEYFQQVTDTFRRLENERDEAIKTKAHISDRKTATAMNTASQAVKSRNRALELVKVKDEKIHDLSERLGESEEWSTAAVAIARYPVLAQIGQNRLGKLLAKRSREMGIEIRKAASERYPNGIGIYHKNVVDDVARFAG